MSTDLKQAYIERAVQHNINLNRLMANINRISLSVALSTATTEESQMMSSLELDLDRKIDHIDIRNFMFEKTRRVLLDTIFHLLDQPYTDIDSDYIDTIEEWIYDV